MEHHNVLVMVLYCSFLITILIFFLFFPPLVTRPWLAHFQFIFMLGKTGLQNLEKSPFLPQAFGTRPALAVHTGGSCWRGLWVALWFHLLTGGVCYRFKNEKFQRGREKPLSQIRKMSIVWMGSNLNPCIRLFFIFCPVSLCQGM